MAKRYKTGPGSKEIVLPFPLTPTHLADATGLTAVHVNRMLKRLGEDHLVYIRRHAVQILDWNGLAEIGQFDANYLRAGLRPEERMRVVEAV